MSISKTEMDDFDQDLIQKEHPADPIDVNTSISSLAAKPISFDNILQHCGDLGLFQLIHYFFINLISMAAAIVGFYYVFAAAEPEHRCRLPANVWPDDTHYYSVNSTHEALINLFIPKTSDGKWEQCLRYTTEKSNSTLVRCPNGWVYDRSVFGYTYTEEANLICGSETRKSWLATLMQCGGFSLLIIGTFADRYGRKKITAILSILLFIICVITQIIMQWMTLSADVKFILLLLNQFASGLTASAFSLIFILMLELTSSAHTGLASNVALISFTLGEVIVTGFAYVAQDWQILKWADTAFIGLVIPYLYFMPESPLYMYSKREYKKLEALLRQIATLNKRKEIDWLPVYQELLLRKPLTAVNDHELTFFQKVRQILTHRPTIMKLLITALLGFTTLMLYIKLSFGLAAMSISPYLGILIGAAVEAAGYVAGSLLISTKLARKGSFILMAMLTVICVTLIPITVKRSPMVTVFIAQFGKFAISGSIAVSWIFVPELFPTSIRSGANGIFIGASRIGAIVAPIISTSISADYQAYTFYASSGLAIIVVLLTLILPETKHTKMDDEHDYVTTINEIS